MDPNRQNQAQDRAADPAQDRARNRAQNGAQDCAPDLAEQPAPPAGCVHARVRGRVQGVGYRAWCVDQATALQLVGWVRNRADGSVEAWLQGPPDRVTHMLQALQHGPRGARVVEVAVDHPPPPWPDLVGFEFRPTR